MSCQDHVLTKEGSSGIWQMANKNSSLQPTLKDCWGVPWGTWDGPARTRDWNIDSTRDGSRTETPARVDIPPHLELFPSRRPHTIFLSSVSIRLDGSTIEAFRAEIDQQSLHSTFIPGVQRDSGSSSHPRQQPKLLTVQAISKNYQWKQFPVAAMKNYYKLNGYNNTNLLSYSRDMTVSHEIRNTIFPIL